jgi:hypothetical protein
MSVIDQLKPFLGDIAHLTDESSDGKTTYIHPKLRNLGSVSLVLIREMIAPTVFRNLEAEITDITVGDRRRFGTGSKRWNEFARPGAPVMDFVFFYTNPRFTALAEKTLYAGLRRAGFPDE